LIENTILAHLLHDEQYARKVLPFLKPEYFEDVNARQNRALFEIIREYSTKYGRLPTHEAIDVELGERVRDGFSDEVAQKAHDLLPTLVPDKNTDPKWLLATTEGFCKKKAVYQGMLRTIAIQQGEMRGQDVDALPEIWRDAISVSFDSDLGHDYLEDAQVRYDSYKKQERRIPFDLTILNKITRGGLPSKSLSVIMAPTGVGKSQVMGHLAAAQLMMGKNVIYFTLEMSAIDQIGERIDSNLMGVDTRAIAGLSHDVFMTKINGMRKKTLGKLIIKEYPTASAGVTQFRRFIQELQLKKGFKPDIIYVDYINLCQSSRLAGNNEANSYTIVKFIAEELRGLAMELDVPVVTATQTNRGGFKNTDIDMDSTAESWGLPQTADFMIALISTEEFESKGQLMFKQLKNRWCGTTDYNRFMLGIDRARMRLHELDEATAAFNSPGPRPAPVGLNMRGFT